jgi:hypothetical protein
MDQMLGRPEVDPHGDPIPNSEGLVKPQQAQSLLTCPLRTPVTVSRVIDQDRVFLRFIEQNNLKPGESIEVEDRDAASDSVRVRGKNDRQIVIGTRAASKLLVNIAGVIAPCGVTCVSKLNLSRDTVARVTDISRGGRLFMAVAGTRQPEGSIACLAMSRSPPLRTSTHPQSSSSY